MNKAEMLEVNRVLKKIAEFLGIGYECNSCIGNCKKECLRRHIVWISKKIVERLGEGADLGFVRVLEALRNGV